MTDENKELAGRFGVSENGFDMKAETKKLTSEDMRKIKENQRNHRNKLNREGLDATGTRLKAAREELSDNLKTNMSGKELARRYTLFVISLFFAALGVAITKKGELGVTPTSSIANVMSLQFTHVSMGKWLIIWNCVLILGQLLLLRKNFKLIQLLQIPLSVVFGYFTDFCLWMVDGIDTDSYVAQLSLVFIGTAVLAFGVSLAVIANVVMNSAEAFVKAVSDVTNANFGDVKILFDIICVIFAVALSLVFFDMKVEGTREGTIIAAILTGLIVKFYLKIFKKPVDRLLTGRKG